MKFNTRKADRENVTLQELFAPKERRSFTEKPIGMLYEFYLSGVVDSPDEYIQWFDVIRNAGENDVVKIYINSCGGDLGTALQFRRVLQETNAQVVCSIEGYCMSAATIIFLCGHVLELTPHSMFMVHNYSGGTMGKGNEMHDQIKFERPWSEKLLRDVYQDFLSEEEITKVLDGKDLWLDTEEVALRCELRMEEMEKREASEESTHSEM